MHPYRFSAVTLLLLATACSSSMSKEECRTVDWRTVGYEDGVAGRAGDRIGEHRRACAEYGVRPDLAAYQAGRTQGLREYCQPHNGYRYGAEGRAYFGACPADLAPAFVEAYDAGHELYVREQRVIDTDASIAYKRREIARLEDSIANAGLTVIDDASTTADRTQAVLDTKQRAERIGRLKSEIAQLQKDRVRYARELETYRATVAAR
jgi:hypothetical protein